MQELLVVLGLAASVPVLLLQEWTRQPVKPDITFQQFMREAQFADEDTWTGTIVEVSQYQHRCATFRPNMSNPNMCNNVEIYHVCAESCQA